MTDEETIGTLIMERRRVAIEGYREMLPIADEDNDEASSRFDILQRSYDDKLRAIETRLEEFGVYFHDTAWADIQRWLEDDDDCDSDPSPVTPVSPSSLA